MAVQMLQSGKVAQNWMGFTWIPYQGLTYSASTYYAYAVGQVQAFISARATRKAT
jgi:roadblock/LC7 domain-containing protein